MHVELPDIESYRAPSLAQGQQPEIQEGPTAVYGEGAVAGFVLELARIWA